MIKINVHNFNYSIMDYNYTSERVQKQIPHPRALIEATYVTGVPIKRKVGLSARKGIAKPLFEQNNVIPDVQIETSCETADIVFSLETNKYSDKGIVQLFSSLSNIEYDDGLIAFTKNFLLLIVAAFQIRRYFYIDGNLNKANFIDLIETKFIRNNEIIHRELFELVRNRYFFNEYVKVYGVAKMAVYTERIPIGVREFSVVHSGLFQAKNNTGNVLNFNDPCYSWIPNENRNTFTRVDPSLGTPDQYGNYNLNYKPNRLHFVSLNYISDLMEKVLDSIYDNNLPALTAIQKAERRMLNNIPIRVFVNTMYADVYLGKNIDHNVKTNQIFRLIYGAPRHLHTRFLENRAL